MKKQKTAKTAENQNTNSEKFLGVKALARASGLSESFIRKLKTHSKLPHYKVGGRVLFKFSEFDHWMKEEKRA